jgi:hypothetical protein
MITGQIKVLTAIDVQSINQQNIELMHPTIEETAS